MPDAALYIGLMSGTSLDGVDSVVARFDSSGKPTLAGRESEPFPEPLRRELLALNTPGDNELARAALASNALATVYAAVVTRLLQATGLAPRDITAIGAHGQTVRHQPGLGYTIQLNAPALLAELTDISVVADFRAREVAAGRLRVQVPDQAWRLQLTELELDYRQEFARLLGKGKVERIVFETGEQAAVQAPSPKGKRR